VTKKIKSDFIRVPKKHQMKKEDNKVFYMHFKILMPHHFGVSYSSSKNLVAICNPIFVASFSDNVARFVLKFCN